MDTHVPEERPSISGHLPSYRLGDRLRVNCSSGPAMPAPHLTWFINGEEVGPHLIRAYQLSVSEYLKSSVLQLVSEVRHNFFRDGIMKLKCTSAIGEKYWQSTETLIGQLGDPRRGTPSQLAGRAGQRYADQQMEVRHNFFRDGIMKLKCTSAIGEKYWQSTETLIGQLGDPRRGTPSQLAGRAGQRYADQQMEVTLQFTA
ncbi:uncharacterized protein LOC119098778 [Pollicipes pollicipes]|uniref:uncharacterized protein LOC119098778 n=1 Tax=Pollicipes pollicipes TaxID=41117 RepID=UPI001884D06C|nr:uncharacterized protein LOC119098778 [Pollicipes pollicipes]